ncbi:MAG: ferrous iron transport protein A [Bacillota bacterium]
MTLDQAKKGSEIEIIKIPCDESRSQLIRMGIAEGTKAVCHEKLPLGPVILKCKHQEIAIGRQLARSIVVK